MCYNCIQIEKFKVHRKGKRGIRNRITIFVLSSTTSNFWASLQVSFEHLALFDFSSGDRAFSLCLSYL